MFCSPAGANGREEDVRGWRGIGRLFEARDLPRVELSILVQSVNPQNLLSGQ